MKPINLKKAVAGAMAFLFCGKPNRCSVFLLKSISSVLLLVAVLASLESCKKKTAMPIDPAFAQYVSAFTSGSISSASTIRLRFTDSFAGDVVLNEPVKEQLIDFSPNIEGDLVWVDVLSRANAASG